MQRRLIGPAIAAAALAVTLGPLLLDRRLREPKPAQAAVLLAVAGIGLTLYRKAPVVTVLIACVAVPIAALTGGLAQMPAVTLVLLPAFGGVAGAELAGALSYVAGAALAVAANTENFLGHASGPAATMLIATGFVAGLALRRRREMLDALAERSRELEHERELYATLSVQHERARIAAEIHDIVGHAITVMVVQAAAGRRLVDRDPDAAGKVFSVIAGAAQQGSEDLDRLVTLLAGDEREIDTSDLDLIQEVVQRAAGSGLDVTFRIETDHAGIAADTARAAFRVVQEGLTNALRHAPGSPVEIVVRRQRERELVVRVENGPPPETPASPVEGTGTGLRGLRERLQAAGGRCAAGRSPGGGWVLEATIPSPRA